MPLGIRPEQIHRLRGPRFDLVLREGPREIQRLPAQLISLDTGAPEPPGLVLTFDDNKAVTGLHMSRMNLVKNNNLQPWVS